MSHRTGVETAYSCLVLIHPLLPSQSIDDKMLDALVGILPLQMIKLKKLIERHQREVPVLKKNSSSILVSQALYKFAHFSQDRSCHFVIYLNLVAADAGHVCKGRDCEGKEAVW